MANTTNYNWETPDDTDLVKDGAAAIRTLGSSIDTTTKNLNPETTLGDIAYRSATANTNTRLAIGTTGQVLTVAGGVPTWATSDDANAIQNAIVDAKGDIVAASAADTPARLAVGTDNQRLVAASGETTGLKYVSDTQNTVIDAEGDLLVGDTADTVQRLAIGSNAQVLTVDTTVDGKIKWATPAAGGGDLVKISTDSFSAVSSITKDSVFSATYDNYLILVEFTASATASFNFYLRSSSSNITANYDRQYLHAASTTVGAARSTAAGEATIANSLSTGRNYIVLNLASPYLGQNKSWISQCLPTFNSVNIENSNGTLLNTSVCDGIYFYPNTGTITGKVSIYGYKV